MSQITQNIQQRVAQYIAQERLISPPCTRVYVGLSGGPDSVALLHILTSLGYACEALHCNFHLRGQESQRDMQFCQQLCQELHVPLQVREFDTRAYMAQHHLSLEMAARELRYDWWASLTDFSIALGHHQDDSIETLLMNLMRGTGAQGLTGIVPHNEATHVIRPLLCLSRQDILDYLLDNDLSYVIDSTNADCDTLRNQIRHQLLPLMEQLVPQTRTGILTTMQHIAETTGFAERCLRSYDHLTEHHSQWGIEWDELPLAQMSGHFSPAEAEGFLFDWQRRHCHATTQRVVRTSSLIYTQPLDDTLIEQHRPTLSTELCDASPVDPHTIRSSDLCQYLDADSFTPPLTLRRWHEGDRFTPLGMHGHTKLVSDLFTDAHYSPMQKATTWLLTDATGAILWVAGLRISERHKITEDTKRVMRIEIVGTL